MHENENTRCAPSKKFEDGSCFTLDSLKFIATKYNESNTTNKINIIDDKLKLVEDITKKLSSSCSTQICWLRNDILKNIDNEEITNNTFRPIGPKSKYEWLSTTNINDVIDQYHTHNKDFLFMGTVPYDFQELKVLGLNNFNFNKIFEEGKNKLGMVINLDESHQTGSHWVSLYTDLKKNQIYFFDSVGKPPKKKIKTFINKIVEFMYKKKYNKDIDVSTIMSLIKQVNNKNNKIKYLNMLNTNLNPFDIRYNNIQHQFKNSECGVYSINFIVRSLKGESFDNIINNITSDDKMNECRQLYFINE